MVEEDSLPITWSPDARKNFRKAYLRIKEESKKMQSKSGTPSSIWWMPYHKILSTTRLTDLSETTGAITVHLR